MTRCKHKIVILSEPRGYSGGVAQRSVDMNSRAAGGITQTEVCTVCNATRRVNKNGRHIEYSLWSKPQ